MVLFLSQHDFEHIMITVDPPVALPLELQHVDAQLHFVVLILQILPLELRGVEPKHVQVHLEFHKQSRIDRLLH